MIYGCRIPKNICVGTYPQHSPPRWVIGTGQLGRLRFRPGPLPVGGGGMTSFGSASTTQYSLYPTGHARLYKRVDVPNILSRFVVGRPGSEYGLLVAVILTFERNLAINVWLWSQHSLPKWPVLWSTPNLSTKNKWVNWLFIEQGWPWTRHLTLR